MFRELIAYYTLIIGHNLHLFIQCVLDIVENIRLRERVFRMSSAINTPERIAYKLKREQGLSIKRHLKGFAKPFESKEKFVPTPFYTTENLALSLGLQTVANFITKTDEINPDYLPSRVFWFTTKIEEATRCFLYIKASKTNKMGDLCTYLISMGHISEQQIYKAFGLIPNSPEAVVFFNTRWSDLIILNERQTWEQ